MYGKNTKLSKAELSLLNSLENGVAAYDFADEAPTTPQRSDSLRLAKIPGNPAFRAQFDISITIKYFTESSDVYTLKTAAQILSASSTLANRLPAFLFGNSDFASGFKKAQGQFPLTTWAYNPPVVYGKDVATAAFGAWDSTVTAYMQAGDLVLPYTATVSATNYMAVVIISCQQVGYASLLDAVNSDRFWLNNLRYVLSDTSTAGLTQYNNNLTIQAQSLFGKFKQDTVSPNSFKQPEQFQSGIVDIPIKQGIDKNVLIGSYINYDSVSQQWSIFVSELEKVTA